jgi:hypothetical protein
MMGIDFRCKPLEKRIFLRHCILYEPHGMHNLSESGAAANLQAET